MIICKTILNYSHHILNSNTSTNIISHVNNQFATKQTKHEHMHEHTHIYCVSSLSIMEMVKVYVTI